MDLTTEALRHGELLTGKHFGSRPIRSLKDHFWGFATLRASVVKTRRGLIFFPIRKELNHVF
jgi:hypothetical protein